MNFLLLHVSMEQQLGQEKKEGVVWHMLLNLLSVAVVQWRICNIGPVETQAGSLFASVPGEHVDTYAQTALQLCEGSVRALRGQSC